MAIVSIGKNIVKSLMLILTTVLTTGDVPLVDASAQLKSGSYHITQSWSQETMFKRLYYVSAPERPDQQKLPAFIFLHWQWWKCEGGDEGIHEAVHHDGGPVRHGICQRIQGELEHRVGAFPGRRSRIIEAIVKKLSTYDNIQNDNFSIMGNSNGAALVNQLAIESKLPNLRNYVSAVSPLNVYQHDGKNFKAKGG